MIDHAPRILAAEKAAAKQARDQQDIDELERRSAPLLWATFAAVVVIALAISSDAAHQHLEQDQDSTVTNEMFAKCLNGQAIQLGDSILRCQVSHYQLIAGVAQ